MPSNKSSPSGRGSKRSSTHTSSSSKLKHYGEEEPAKESHTETDTTIQEKQLDLSKETSSNQPQTEEQIEEHEAPNENDDASGEDAKDEHKKSNNSPSESLSKRNSDEIKSHFIKKQKAKKSSDSIKRVSIKESAKDSRHFRSSSSSRPDESDSRDAKRGSSTNINKTHQKIHRKVFPKTPIPTKSKNVSSASRETNKDTTSDSDDSYEKQADPRTKLMATVKPIGSSLESSTPISNQVNKRTDITSLKEEETIIPNTNPKDTVNTETSWPYSIIAEPAESMEGISSYPDDKEESAEMTKVQASTKTTFRNTHLHKDGENDEQSKKNNVTDSEGSSSRNSPCPPCSDVDTIGPADTYSLCSEEEEIVDTEDREFIVSDCDSLMLKYQERVGIIRRPKSDIVDVNNCRFKRPKNSPRLSNAQIIAQLEKLDEENRKNRGKPPKLVDDLIEDDDDGGNCEKSESEEDEPRFTSDTLLQIKALYNNRINRDFDADDKKSRGRLRTLIYDNNENNISLFNVSPSYDMLQTFNTPRVEVNEIEPTPIAVRRVQRVLNLEPMQTENKQMHANKIDKQDEQSIQDTEKLKKHFKKKKTKRVPALDHIIKISPAKKKNLNSTRTQKTSNRKGNSFSEESTKGFQIPYSILKKNKHFKEKDKSVPTENPESSSESNSEQKFAAKRNNKRCLEDSSEMSLTKPMKKNHKKCLLASHKRTHDSLTSYTKDQNSTDEDESTSNDFSSNTCEPSQSLNTEQPKPKQKHLLVPSPASLSTKPKISKKEEKASVVKHKIKKIRPHNIGEFSKMGRKIKTMKTIKFKGPKKMKRRTGKDENKTSLLCRKDISRKEKIRKRAFEALYGPTNGGNSKHQKHTQEAKVTKKDQLKKLSNPQSTVINKTKSHSNASEKHSFTKHRTRKYSEIRDIVDNDIFETVVGGSAVDESSTPQYNKIHFHKEKPAEFEKVIRFKKPRLHQADIEDASTTQATKSRQISEKYLCSPNSTYSGTDPLLKDLTESTTFKSTRKFKKHSKK